MVHLFIPSLRGKGLSPGNFVASVRSPGGGNTPLLHAVLQNHEGVGDVCAHPGDQAENDGRFPELLI